MSSEADKEAGVPAQARVHVFAEGRAGAFRSAFASLFVSRSRGSLGLACAQPGTGVRAGDSVRNYLHKSLRSYSRQAGTCPIGTDARAVVDTELRVHGIRGRRVADASVMPCIVSASTNATVYGTAERAAALIRPDAAAALRARGLGA